MVSSFVPLKFSLVFLADGEGLGSSWGWQVQGTTSNWAYSHKASIFSYFFRLVTVGCAPSTTLNAHWRVPSMP